MISEICLIDVATGAVEVVLAHEGERLEAPNWHREGYLIVNGSGRLFRVPLDAPALHEIPTGRIGALNNDHGISPDGRSLAISAKSETGTESCIYLLPVEGGEPRRVTPLTPSWWHGWSPDGTRLAYVGVREPGGPVLPYTCAPDGSDEVRVAEGFDHVDGTDYAPDGTIWFNGERDGSVDLWRVPPGGEPERMTGGETVDWFPHPSPDGRHVLFLAFPPGTKGHPPDLDVALLLLPAGGGEARELARFRGGQGSINVPSWAPGSDRAAFVRYPA